MATKKATKTATADKNYQQLREELDAMILALQDPDCDVDAAAEMYAEALGVIRQLETHLEKAENRIQKVQADFGVGA